MNPSRFSLLFLSVSLLVGLTQSLPAHDLNTSYTEIYIRPTESKIFCSLMIDELDLERMFSMDQNGDKEISEDELQAGADDALAFLRNAVDLQVAGEKVPLTGGRIGFEEDGVGNRFGKFTFENTFSKTPWQVRFRLDIFERLTRLHKNLVKISYGPDEIQQAILTRGYNEETFHFQGDTNFLVRQAGQFLWLGVEHIFTGYDHILFLIGLILIGGSIANLVKMVTAFTVAHSVTLILAALQLVTIPSRLVESVIALSIAYVAVENFFVKENNQRWVIAFSFGLMHGFGFANVLTELGLPAKGLITSLLSFNIGVEFGQLAIVAVTFPLIAITLRTKWKQQFIYGVSACIFVLGLIWFIERAFELDLPIV